MDILSTEFFSALLAIIVIDLVLAGDNAIVIALAARNLPRHLQRVTITAGTAAAVVARIGMTLAIVWLLRIPGLLLAGGILLIWIAYKLLTPNYSKKNVAHASSANVGLWTAIRTIVIADVVMSIDNMLGVAGAAQGEFLLVIVGLLISVPIMVLGSTLILKWVERYSIIIYVGATVLTWTAAKMITNEPVIKDAIGHNDFLVWGCYALLIGGVLISGVIWRMWLKTGHPEKSSSSDHRSEKRLKFNRLDGDRHVENPHSR
jgi:YjbE family integral membrane protein